MSDSKSRFQRLGVWYRSLALIVFNTILVFVVLNLVAEAILDMRIAHQKTHVQASTLIGYRGYHPSLDPVYPGKTKSQIAELVRETRRVSQEYESFTQFKEKATSGTYVAVDPNGFRHGGSQATWPPDPKAFNIFVFGGSTAFGYRVAGDQTIASHLQDLIRKQTNLPVAVYNFGRGAYMAVQERVLFEKLLLRGHVPNIAIFIDGLNEFALPDGEPAHTKKLKKLVNELDMSLSARIVRELPVTKLLLLISGKTETNQGTGNANERKIWGNSDEDAKRILNWYLTNKKMITAIAKAFNVTPVFVWQPVPVYEYDQQYNIFGKVDYDNYCPPLRPGYRIMAAENRSGSLGDNFIWCADIQRGVNKALYVDWVHYSGEMCNMIARRILDELKKRGLIPSHGVAINR